MYGIGDFFRKIQNSFSKEIILRNVIVQVIKNHIGLDVPIESITLKNNEIVLKNLSQSARSAIFVRKQLILKAIEESDVMRKFKDIR